MNLTAAQLPGPQVLAEYADGFYAFSMGLDRFGVFLSLSAGLLVAANAADLLHWRGLAAEVIASSEIVQYVARAVPATSPQPAH